ncbi:MAG: protein phosphatase CheZ [Xanthobacteraceae bacterium]
MALTKADQLDQIASYLKDQRKGSISFADVISLAEIAAQSLRTFFVTMDSTVYKELQEIAGYIESMKGEIGGLQANELKESRIPAAGQELSAIVKATENATNTIMECAETLMAADASDPVAYKALVDAKMMVIFEACSFQDITGQRVAKVVDTLQHIESRVSRFATAVRTEDHEGFLDETEQARAERRDRLMLHGPQLDGKGIDQSDVDSMFQSS